MGCPSDEDQTAPKEYESGTKPDAKTVVVHINDDPYDDEYTRTDISRSVEENEDGENILKHMNNTEAGEEGWLGNPYRLEDGYSREEAIEKFKLDFAHRVAEDKEFKRRLMNVQGNILVCYCKPKDCHGDVIAEYVDKHRGTESYRRAVEEGRDGT